MDRIAEEKIPRHIAIIMDGNGRWAKQHSLGRIAGHKKGSDAVRNIVRSCHKIGVEYLTLYALSTENWLRPVKEVNALMNLLEKFLRSEVKEMQDNGIRLRSIGDITRLPDKVRETLIETMENTSSGNKMTLILALNYGSHDEIVRAVKNITGDVKKGYLSTENIDRDTISKYLYTAEIPDPDLLIRTSGEYRLSNFLLWQSAYTEFYFTETLWPDFNEEHLIQAILEYRRRERRFGLTSDQIAKKNGV
jgi:undecaprenyl diphosphate synthase